MGIDSRMDLDGREPVYALGRLEYVVGQVLPRGAAPDRPAYEVHVHGPCERLLADPRCRAALESIAQQQTAAGGVVLIFHGDGVELASALDAYSKRILAAFAAGKVVRHQAPNATPRGRWEVPPVSATEARLYSASLSARVWAALMLEQPGELVEAFKELREAAAQAGGPAERRLLSDALRRAADWVLPGSGGMVQGVTHCSLCLGSPVLRPDEVPGHLLEKHSTAIQSPPPRREVA